MKKLLLTLAVGIAMLSLPVFASAAILVNMTGVVTGTTTVRFLTSNGKRKLPVLTLALLKGKLVSIGSVTIDNGSNKARILFPDIESVVKGSNLPAEIQLVNGESALLKVGHTLSGHAILAVSYPSNTYIRKNAGKGKQCIVTCAASVNSAWVTARGKNTGRAAFTASGFAPYAAYFYNYSSDGAGTTKYLSIANYYDATVSMLAIHATFHAYSTNSPIY